MSSHNGWSETECLDMFLHQAIELFDTRIWKSGSLNTQFSIHFDQNEGLRFTARNLDEEYLRSFLVVFRSFISDKEPVYIGRIRGILMRNLDSTSPLRTALDQSKKQWNRECSQGLTRLQVNGEDYDAERIMDLWINGCYFHSDKRKRSLLENLFLPGQVLARQGFLDHLGVAAGYVGYLRKVVSLARRDGLISV